MGSSVKERTIEEIKIKLDSMNTELNKLSYIEIALKESTINSETKRYLLEIGSELYENKKMFEKAAKAISNKASMDVLTKERIESYLKAAELYSRAGKINYSEDIFLRASREANTEQKSKIKLARQNIYSKFAQELDENGKKASALKFYEKLIQIHQIDPIEKEVIKKRLVEIYNSLGMFHESKITESM